ncbi:methylamine utilization protein MauE [Stackebrandtia albiflava]|uniref:Methylamine utilization protein MauE n=2 Tax=Stackebrandtia albiflava TaxID=406432 RepID=A0A562V4F7_9ACTN|nr:methylamine utilization protein MauE [Stackebrandtia albiflava]
MEAATGESLLDRTVPWVGLAARLIVGGVWLVAGGLKVSDLRSSIRAVQVYELLPNSLAEFVGIVLPLVEVGIGLLLIAGLATQPAAVVSALLLVAFIVGIGSAWARGLQIDCGCFGGGGQLGEGEKPQYLAEILRDIGLLALTGLLVWRPRTPFSADRILFKTK